MLCSVIRSDGKRCGCGGIGSARHVPDRVGCEFCGKPAVDERNDRDGRAMAVCDFCAEDIDRGDEMDRRERERERAIDQQISEWKDGGR